MIANVTARKPLFCFDACRLECRCISFNFKQSADQDNCQLNEENRSTNFGALEFAEGWQYYDLVYNNIRVREIILLLNIALFISLSNKIWHSSMTFNDIILKFVFLWQTWLWGFATFCSNTCYLGRGILCSTFFFSLIFRLLIVRTTAVKAILALMEERVVSPVTSLADVSRVNVVLTLMGDSVRVVIIHFSCL